MSSSHLSRTQVVLRVPIDVVDACLILHDGERSDVMLFVPPSEAIAHFVSEGPPFVPLVRDGHEIFVARAAIACLGIPPYRAPHDDGLPVERQLARVTLRCGVVVEGLLRWVSLDGRRRTSDGLNADCPYLVVEAESMTYLVMKAHVATVSES